MKKFRIKRNKNNYYVYRSWAIFFWILEGSFQTIEKANYYINLRKEHLYGKDK